MQDGVGAIHRPSETANVRDVTLNELKALGEDEVPGRKIVVNENFEPVATQCVRRMATDVACAADHKNLHGIPRVGSGRRGKRNQANRDEPWRRAVLQRARSEI